MKRYLFSALLLLFALLVGCQDNVKAPYAGRSDPYENTQVSFSGTYGTQLQHQTAVGRISVVRDPQTNLLRVTVPIRSAVNDTLYVEYQATFLDASGQQLSQLAWTPKTLEANVPNEIAFTSLSANAADFRVAFRFAR